ncbi:MAG: glycosyltransferase family 2 protein [Cryobacterium sp.]|uniref:glycosyltransferase family 2 protein n=1 Tax=unclassified Cryobacterium TaxID=2649013 RepID=UPI0018CB2B25|nr:MULTISPECIES: glycosyltransferase family A protein [unclassified Cryobacterium]MCY7404853.1 glycosyltransferase family 2 protein [Cryobacterium sp.]MEC5154840.1 succinoglycan biosynthesis protein ExoM [Cryobacterium sp. CAN_C3]
MSRVNRSTTDQCVVIAVLTYRRPSDLEKLLPALLDQADMVLAPVEIVVIDNDPDAGARALVAETSWLEAAEPASTRRASIRYVHEPTPGIASARNRALQEGRDADLLIFIDDDERPSSHWLVQLLDTYSTYRPAAVVGPVLSQFDTEPDQWIRAGGFFERRRFTTGTPVSLAATNNLLLDLAQVRRLGLSFDERFGLSGGSDSLFTRQLHQRGGQMIWCDEAIVIDVVPVDRLTREWVLQRAFRMGNTWSRINLDETENGRRILVRLNLQARGVARVCGGIVRYLAGSVVGQVPLRARGLRTAARGAGMLAGSVGSVYHEYKRG